MGDLRRHDRAAAVESLGADLAEMQAAIESAHRTAYDLESCLAAMAEGELVDWVAVAVHRMPDGSSRTCIHGHPDRTALQVKGILHDGIWAAAHQPH